MKVLGKFSNFLNVRHNVIFERVWFNQRNQHPGKTVEEYITALHQLARGCQYGEMTKKLIRNQLVAGIRDESLSERLQIESNLTLEKVESPEAMWYCLNFLFHFDHLYGLLKQNSVGSCKGAITIGNPITDTM